MENHKQGKSKPIALNQVIKTRKTEVLNADFFNENKYNNNNFVKLPENPQNYQNNENYNTANYNSNVQDYQKQS